MEAIVGLGIIEAFSYVLIRYSIKALKSETLVPYPQIRYTDSIFSLVFGIRISEMTLNLEPDPLLTHYFHL